MAEVLVVGAGPVGLTMAAELMRHGVRCRIIDRLAQPLPYCRAIGVTSRTIEVWDDMGIAQQMIDAGLWLRGMRSIVDGSPAHDLQIDLSDLPYGHLGVPQPATERVMTKHLARLGLEVERSVSLLSFEQDATNVHANLSHADGSTEKVGFKYIVGGDGAHSVVRRTAGIPFEGDQFPLNFMLGDVYLDCDLERGMALRVVHTNEDGPPDFLVAIPLPERNRYRVSMFAPNQNFSDADMHGVQTERTPPTLDELQAAADRLLPGKVGMSDPRWSSLFRISMRLAAQYRAGRAFLAGDAAHIHPPTGGQGMNTGIQDAYNLAWKMALVLQGSVSEDLLDSYEAERRPVGADVVARTRAQSERFGREKPKPQDRLVDTQILVNYRGSRLSKDEIDGAGADLPVRAGGRAPDCGGLRREGVHYRLRMFDVTRGTDYVLLVYFAEAIGPETIGSLERIASLFKAAGLPIRVVAIFAAGVANLDVIGVSTLEDTEKMFAASYSASHNSGYLIRPDGYVGYNARPMNENGVTEYLRKAGFKL